MHYGPRQASRFALEIVPELGLLVHQNPHILSILCPPAISLSAVREVMDAHLFGGIELGAQNMYFEEKGAYTGEISPPMVRELCTTVILGHSERRTYFGETDEMVNKKALAAFNHNLRPIICIGEHLEEYEAGKTEEVIRFQVQHSFAQFPAQHVKTTAEGAGNVIHLIRQLYGEMYGSEAATALRILYGGSVTSDNISEFVAHPDIDGALVGGASIKPDFVEIVRKTIEVMQQ